MSTLANRIKEQRLKNGLSQSQFAEVIGMTKQTISLWERGVRRPEFVTLNYVADYFGVNMGYLVGQTDDPTVRERNYDELASMAEDDTIRELEGLATQLSQLSEEGKRIVAATIRETYRVEREAGRLEEGYTVSITRKRPRLV